MFSTCVHTQIQRHTEPLSILKHCYSWSVKIQNSSACLGQQKIHCSTAWFPEKWLNIRQSPQATFCNLAHPFCLKEKKYHLPPWSCQTTFSKRSELKRLRGRGSCVRSCIAIKLYEGQHSDTNYKEKRMIAKSIGKTQTRTPLKWASKSNYGSFRNTWYETKKLCVRISAKR